MERPELRTFPFDPVERVMLNRGSYVAACLTIVRAYLAAGSPDRCKPLASFEQWSDLVRSALVWLGCADPCESIQEAREDDPELSALRAVVEAWRAGLGLTTPYTTGDLITLAGQREEAVMGEPTDYKHPDLRNALLEIAGEKGNSSSRLRKFRCGDGADLNSLILRERRIRCVGRTGRPRQCSATSARMRWCQRIIRCVRSGRW